MATRGAVTPSDTRVPMERSLAPVFSKEAAALSMFLVNWLTSATSRARRVFTVVATYFLRSHTFPPRARVIILATFAMCSGACCGVGFAHQSLNNSWIFGVFVCLLVHRRCIHCRSSACRTSARTSGYGSMEKKAWYSRNSETDSLSFSSSTGTPKASERRIQATRSRSLLTQR